MLLIWTLISEIFGAEENLLALRNDRAVNAIRQADLDRQEQLIFRQEQAALRSEQAALRNEQAAMRVENEGVRQRQDGWISRFLYGACTVLSLGLANEYGKQQPGGQNRNICQNTVVGIKTAAKNTGDTLVRSSKDIGRGIAEGLKSKKTLPM